MVRVLERSVSNELDYASEIASSWMSKNHYEVGIDRRDRGWADSVLVERIDGEEDDVSAVITPSTRTIEVYEGSVFETMRSLAFELEKKFGGDEYRVARFFD